VCTEACAEDLLPHLLSGAIRPVVDSTFALEDIAAAHARLASNDQLGKIVMVMP
jgi:NADPH:quinone reductase-like Zn-dependent oxidoreductase